MRVRFSYIWTAIATCLPMAAAGASEVSPVDIIANYISLSSENPEQSKKLLLPDAGYMIFDYGGPLAEFFPEFVKLLPGSGCSKPIIQTEERRPNATNVDKNVFVVRVEWQCTKPTESVLASNVVRFVVAQQKIGVMVFEDPPGYPPRLNSGNANTGDR